jgi:hypothetical protein
MDDMTYEAGCIAMAARKLKFAVGLDKATKAFFFADLITGRHIWGRPNEDPKKAFHSACIEFTNYIKWTPNQSKSN